MYFTFAREKKELGTQGELYRSTFSPLSGSRKNPGVDVDKYVALSHSKMFQLFLLPHGGRFFSQIVSVTTVACDHFAHPLFSDF